VGGFVTGDVTGDGRIDAVLTVSESDELGQPLGERILVAQNSAGSPLAHVTEPIPESRAVGPYLADVDGHPGLDIVMATPSGMGYLNASGFCCSSWIRLPGLGGLSDVQEFAVGYFNADAAPDVVAVRGTGDAVRFSLLVSQVSGVQRSYQERPLPFVPPGEPCDLDAGELNGDGKADLVLLGCGPDDEVPLDRRIMTLLGDGTGGFGQSSWVPSSGRSSNGPTGVAIVDLDGNGLGEVILTESDSATVIYMNHSVVVEPPSPPPPPPPPPPPGCRPRADCTAPKAKVKVAGKRWRIRKPLVVSVRCNERCTATVSVQLLFSRRGRVLRSIPVRERPRLDLRPSGHAKVTFRLPSTRRRTLAALIRRGLRANARISVRVVDPSGNGSTVTRTVRLTL
jgi:hypothetical protein